MLNDINYLLECSYAIKNFLLYSDDEFERNKNFSEIETLKIMSDKLKHCGLDISGFTMFLNGKYKITDKPLWGKSAREFFSDHKKSIDFYKKVINKLSRKKKLEKICSKLEIK